MKKTVALLGLALTSLSAIAQEAAVEAAEVAVSAGMVNYSVPAMAIALGIAAIGGTLAQGRIVSSAMDGISRNPQAQSEMFIPMILGLAFIESLVIFALIYKYL